MNAKFSLFDICIEAIIYLLLYNLHGSTFNTAQYEYIFNLTPSRLWQLLQNVCLLSKHLNRHKTSL